MFENKKSSFLSLAVSCLILSSTLSAAQSNDEMVQSMSNDTVK